MVVGSLSCIWLACFVTLMSPHHPYLTPNSTEISPHKAGNFSDDELGSHKSFGIDTVHFNRGVCILDNFN